MCLRMQRTEKTEESFGEAGVFRCLSLHRYAKRCGLGLRVCERCRLTAFPPIKNRLYFFESPARRSTAVLPSASNRALASSNAAIRRSRSSRGKLKALRWNSVSNFNSPRSAAALRAQGRQLFVSQKLHGFAASVTISARRSRNADGPSTSDCSVRSAPNVTRSRHPGANCRNVGIAVTRKNGKPHCRPVPLLTVLSAVKPKFEILVAEKTKWNKRSFWAMEFAFSCARGKTAFQSG